MPGLPRKSTAKQFNKLLKASGKSKTNKQYGGRETTKKISTYGEHMITKFDEFLNEKFVEKDEFEINGHMVVVTMAAPSNTAGGVQIDIITIMVNDEEYEFEIASLASGDIFIYPKFGSGELYDHFGLKEDESMEESELKDFLTQNDDSCIGETTEIDGFEIEIIDFSNSGGVEEGYVIALIDGEEYQFSIIQDATHMNTEIHIEFDSDIDEEKAKKNGIELDEELKDFLYSEYDRISNEHQVPIGKS